MAKIQTLIGGASGKLGGSVFAKGLDGKTIGRIYQPKVSNPRTEGQVTQRSKVNLMGQLTALFNKKALITLGKGIPMKNRMEFNSRIMKAIEVTGGSNPVAHIAFERVEFSTGADIVRGDAIVDIMSQLRKVSVTISQDEVVSNYAERVFVLVMKGREGEGYDCGMFKDVVFTGGTEATVTFDLPQDLVNGMSVAVYRVPIDLTAEGARVVYERMQSGASDDIIAATLSSSSYVNAYGKTAFVGVEVYDNRLSILSVTPMTVEDVENGENYEFAITGRNLGLLTAAHQMFWVGGTSYNPQSTIVDNRSITVIDSTHAKASIYIDMEDTVTAAFIGKNMYPSEIKDIHTEEVVWTRG